MHLTNDGKIYAYILLASVFFSLFALTFGFFPHLALSLSFIFFTLIAYHVKGEKTATTKTFLTITLILSAFLFIRSEMFVTLLNIFAIFYFGILMLLADDDNLFTSLVSVASSPFAFLAQSIFTKSKYHLEYADAGSKNAKKEKYIYIVTTVLLTLLVLSIIIPLLAWANPIFEKLVITILDFFGLRDIKISESLFQRLIRVIFFLVLIILVPKMATQVNKKTDYPNLPTPDVNMLFPKIAVTCVLIVFFITQLQLYFSTGETLKNLGYTLSQYAREVFAQLSTVAVVIVALLFNDKGKKDIDKAFTYALLLAGLFLTLMSYKSVYDYSHAWGFTYKRLYGFTVATWILGIFILYFYTYKKALKTNFFVYSSIILTGLVLIAVNLANFDYLIYHFKKSATGSGIDYIYLTSLSSDPLSYKDQVDKLINISKSTPLISHTPDNNPHVNTLLRKIDFLQLKYKKFDFRGFNLLEYLSYRQIKDVDTGLAREQILISNP